jgi:hypothetical protein
MEGKFKVKIIPGGWPGYNLANRGPFYSLSGKMKKIPGRKKKYFYSVWKTLLE